MRTPPPAIVDLDALTIQSADGLEADILHVEQGLLVHRGVGCEHQSYKVSLPSGCALGSYRLKTNARAAARVLAPLVINPQAVTLADAFGSEEKGWEACAAVRPLFA